MTTYRKFWQDLPRMDFVEYVNDFLTTGSYLATDWNITALQGTNTIAVNAALPNGVLELATGATDNDGSGYQQKIEAYWPVAGKALEFEARFKIADVTECDLVIGLQITDTTPLAVATGIYFAKDDGDALLDFHSVKASVDGSIAGVAALVNDTWIKVGFYYDGGNTIDVFINDVRVGALAAATYLPTGAAEQMCISIAFVSGSTGAKTLSIDYLRVCQQR